MTEVDRATRLAIALYPQRWRDEYATPIVSTLLDVADAEGRTRPAPVEVAVLAARGSWLRARVSPVFWGGLVMLSAYLVATPGLAAWWLGASLERSWTTAIASTGEALPAVLPLVVVLSMLQAQRRSVSGFGPMARDLAPIAAWLLVGAGVALAFRFAASGWPPTTGVDQRYPLTFLAMLAGAGCAGYALGRLVPRRSGVVVVAAASILWWWTAWGLPNHAWRNLSGFNFVNYPADIYRTVPHSAFVASTVIGCIELVIAIAIVGSPRVVGRVVGIAVVAGMLVVLTVGRAPLLLAVGSHLYENRDRAELSCSANVCLWPEQEALSGATIRATLASAERRGEALGLPAPDGISVAPDARSQLPVSLPASSTRHDVISEYADEYASYLGCPHENGTSNGYYENRIAAAVAMSVVFGDSLRDVPYEVTDSSTAVLTGARLGARYGIHDRADAEAVAKAWLVRGPKC